MATTYIYYELRGLGESARTKMPSGMLRIGESEDGLWYERITLDGNWVMDNSLARHFSGDSDEAEETTQKKADAFVNYLRSGQAAIDKARGTWR
jgi:hypothetical protein